jgi:hypothetical protein
MMRLPGVMGWLLWIGAGLAPHWEEEEAMNSLVPMMLVDLGGSPPFGLTLLRPMAFQSGDLLVVEPAALPPIGLPVPVPAAVGAFFSHKAGLESEKGERGMELRNWEFIFINFCLKREGGKIEKKWMNQIIEK